MSYQSNKTGTELTPEEQIAVSDLGDFGSPGQTVIVDETGFGLVYVDFPPETQTLQAVTDSGATTTNDITAQSFIKTGGTSAQFLKADGSSDNSTYLTTISGSDHGSLSGLSDDDHAQYALLAGRSGGQTLIGGTGTTDDLILQTTSGVGATGADMIFRGGNNGATEFMRILNGGNVGIGTTGPSARLHTISTTEQLRVGYNTSNYFNATVGNTGIVTLDAVGSGAQFNFKDPIMHEMGTGLTGGWIGLGIVGDTGAWGRFAAGLESGKPYLGFGPGTAARDSFVWWDATNVLHWGSALESATPVIEMDFTPSAYSFKVNATVSGDYSEQFMGVNQYGALGMRLNTTTAQNAGVTVSGPSDTWGRIGLGLDMGEPFLGWGPGNVTRDIFMIRDGGDLAFQFGAPLAEKVRFTADGKVGIGTTGPSARLHTISTTEQLRVGYDASNYYSTTVASNGLVTFDAVGSGSKFTFSDAVELDGDIDHDGSNIGFFGTAPTTKQTALTTQLTTITHTAPVSADYAIQDLIDSSAGACFGFATKDEGNSVLAVIANLQTRVSELETKIKAYGLLA